MGGLLFVLFLLSLPIFWLYGFISFLRGLFGNSQTNTTDQTSLIKEFISDLELIKNRKVSAAKLLTKYHARLGSNKQSQEASYEQIQPRIIEETTLHPWEIADVEKPQVSPQPAFSNVLTQDINSWWERWYEENNINLLLYIGAFLIVSSAAIFVGFSWEQLTGSFKALLLTLFTFSFFVSGFFFYSQTPKLKNAGATFLAIGSLLIPFNGLAWYNFALRDSFSFGQVWLVTSFVSLIVYSFLAYFIQNRFYTYIAGLGGLSLVEALVNVSNLDANYYILGGIFSAFTLLTGSKILAYTNKKEFDQIYSQPLSISSNVIMPIFLTWGLTAAYSSDKLFTWEVVISSFLASFYYLLSYLISRNIALFTLGQLLLTLAFVLLTKTLGYSGAPVFITIFGIAACFQFFGVFLQEKAFKEESYYSFFISIFISLLGLAISYIDILVSPTERFWFTLIFSGLGFSATYFKKQPNYLYLAIGALDIAAFILVTYVLERIDLFHYLGLFYILFGSGLYLLNKLLTKEGLTKWSEVLFNFAVINLFLATIFAFREPGFMLINSLIITAVGFSIRYLFGNSEEFYSVLAGIGVGILATFLAFINPEFSYHQRVYFSLVVSAMGLIAGFWERQPNYYFVSVAGIDLSAFVYVQYILARPDMYDLLGIFYLTFGTMAYAVGQASWKVNKLLSQVFLLICLANIILALLFTANYPGYSLITSTTIVLIAIIASYYFEKTEMIYIAVISALLSTLNILRLLDISFDYYPLAFAALGVLVYLSSQLTLPSRYKQPLVDSGLLITTANPLFFLLFGMGGSFTSSRILEFNSLIGGYVATATLTIEAFLSRKSSLGYLASIAALLTILWHYNYLGIEESQIYFVTIALYFFGLAYLKRGQNQDENRQLFDGIGLFSLLGPLFLQAVPETGANYAFLMGIEGTLLLLAGFSLKYKIYIYAGAAAVAIATLTRIYSYISSIPSWVIIGLGGLAFLAVGIYLLNKRQDKP